MPFDDPLDRTLPQEDDDPLKFEAMLSKARQSRLGGTPPFVAPEVDEKNRFNEEYKKQQQMMLGLEQKYNPDGTPRKKKFSEKATAALNILGAFLSADPQGQRDEAYRRTKASLETGQSERVAKINAEQRREAAAEKEVTARQKIDVDKSYKSRLNEINALEAAGVYDKNRALAEKARADALRIAGLSQGTSAEGAAKIANIDSSTGYNNARAAGTLTTDQKLTDAQNARSMRAKIALAGLGMKPMGSTSEQLSNENGSDIKTIRTPNIRGVDPSIMESLRRDALGSAAAPAPPVSNVTNADLPPGAKPAPFQPDVARAIATAPPPQALAAPAPNASAVALADQGLGKIRGADLTFDILGDNPNASFNNPKYQAARKSANNVLTQSRDLTNQTVGAFVNGTLDNISGFYGLPMVSALRKSLSTAPIEESIQNRLRTRLVSGSEVSDFGTKVLKIAVESEFANLPQAYHSALTKVGTDLGDTYARALQTWEHMGRPEQQKVAREILRGPEAAMRVANLQKSAAMYIKSLADLKMAAKGNPKLADQVQSPPENLYLLSRTDDELRRLFPAAKTQAAIDRIRATGGRAPSTIQPPKESNLAPARYR